MVPPATAKPSIEFTKCTVLMAWHGSGSARQCEPPSVVASSSVAPVTQPCLTSVKSTVASCAAWAGSELDRPVPAAVGGVQDAVGPDHPAVATRTRTARR